MQDPRDPGTLDLVEACKRPLTGAERQKRRRQKLRELKEAEGLRDYRLTDLDVAYLLCAVDDSITLRERADDLQTPSVMGLVDRLFSRSICATSVRFIGTSQGVRNIIKQYKARAEDGWRAHKDLKCYADSLAPELAKVRQERDQLRGQVERLENERRLLEQERCTAMAAARVFEERLRDAGLSTEYRG